jgi:heparan-sulfate lyase
MFAQVLDDGAQVELTTSYQQGAIRGFVDAADIARIGGEEPSAAYAARLQRMYEYTMFLQEPDGSQPMLGDSWVVDTRGLVAEGGRRFGREDMLYAGTGGKEGTKPEYLDTQLPAAGYYVMRTDWTDPQAIYLLTDIAHRWGGWHQHPDALHIDLYAYGKSLLPDSGAYAYSGPQRSQFARTSAHSTVTVDDQDQNHEPAKLQCLDSGDVLSFVDGSQAGYPGITHRRQVLFARPTGEMPPYFVVIDKISGAGRHTADQYFHFLPAPLELNAEALEATTTAPEGPNLKVMALRQKGVQLEQVDSWVSFAYGKKEPRPAVRFRQVGELPLTFVTLLVPFAGATPPDLGAMETELPGGSGAVGISVAGEGFEDLLFAADAPVDVNLGGENLHGRAGLVRLTRAGQIVRRAVAAEP